ncbi:MAG: methyltransferase domain-containing protein [Deltaproteobacteria bacterium]|nr:methyltransferase domain-containing protein [Deltaproteobacteria bacterium]
MNNCRVCGSVFYQSPLLRYENMPAVAQFLPDKDSVALDKGVRLEICQCSGCGLVQLSNDPVAYYKEVIRAAAFSEEMKAFRTKQFDCFVQKYSLKSRKVIEIGCGRGEYLSLLQQSGADSYGLEYSKESVKACKGRGLKVAQGFLDEATCQLDSAPFDAFFILNFLEHLPHPNLALRAIHNNLREAAVGLVEVPNFNMILQDNLFYEFIPDHLFYFTKDTLNTALQINGFEVLESSEVWHDYIISSVVRKKSAFDLSRFYRYQEQLMTEIECYIHQYKSTAIWGAGHQALAIIALMNLADKVKYVVDSAPFKQGKYTPASHIPIVCPDTLRSDPVDAIIVMAASYSDEVVRLIKDEFDQKIPIAILKKFGLENV